MVSGRRVLLSAAALGLGPLVAGHPAAAARQLAPRGVPLGPGLIMDDATATTTVTVRYTQTVAAPAPATPVAEAQGHGPAAPASASSVPAWGSPDAGHGWNGSDAESESPRFGISYAPYRADHECKSAQDIDKDLQRIAVTYSLVRIYGTDCDQVSKLYPAAKAHGLKLFLGIWHLPSVEDETNRIIAGVKGDWNMVHTVSVGNEVVNNGRASVKDVVNAVKTARSMLRGAGYKGPVVTVDTFSAVQHHPELCEQSDYCAVNAHAFFDSSVSAAESGQWLQKTVGRVKMALAAPRRVVVTETGWPTHGDPNGRAVPGLENQKSALDSIRREFAARPGDVILFSAFNDLWKQRDSATFNAEPYWGIGGDVSSSDQ